MFWIMCPQFRDKIIDHHYPAHNVEAKCKTWNINWWYDLECNKCKIVVSTMLQYVHTLTPHAHIYIYTYILGLLTNLLLGTK